MLMKTTIKSPVRVTNDISSQTDGSTGYKETKILRINVINRSELKFFTNTCFLINAVSEKWQKLYDFSYKDKTWRRVESPGYKKPLIY